MWRLTRHILNIRPVVKEEENTGESGSLQDEVESEDVAVEGDEMRPKKERRYPLRTRMVPVGLQYNVCD